MKFFKFSAALASSPSCASHRSVKSWRSNRGYMFAMMLAMLALMAAMGVGLSRLLMTTKATTQMQRIQDNKQLLNSVVMTLSTKAVDGDSDNVLEAPAFSTAVVTGLTAPTGGGFVGTDVANTDAWGRRLGYCAYDYGSAAVTAATGTGLIRGSTASSPTDSWVAIVVISAGPDGVINTPCPAVDTDASSVVATGDDMVAARSYGEMISFGNAQTASMLSTLGTSAINKLCRLGIDGKMVCDIKTELAAVNDSNRFCRVNANGEVVCGTMADSCGALQASKWNAAALKFECINVMPANCGARVHGQIWTENCPSPQTGTISYQCNNGAVTETGRNCLTRSCRNFSGYAIGAGAGGGSSSVDEDCQRTGNNPAPQPPYGATGGYIASISSRYCMGGSQHGDCNNRGGHGKCGCWSCQANGVECWYQ